MKIRITREARRALYEATSHVFKQPHVETDASHVELEMSEQTYGLYLENARPGESISDVIVRLAGVLSRHRRGADGE